MKKLIKSKATVTKIGNQICKEMEKVLEIFNSRNEYEIKVERTKDGNYYTIKYLPLEAYRNLYQPTVKSIMEVVKPFSDIYEDDVYFLFSVYPRRYYSKISDKTEWTHVPTMEITVQINHVYRAGK